MSASKIWSRIKDRLSLCRKWMEAHPHKVQLIAVAAVPTIMAIGITTYYLLQPPTLAVTDFMTRLEKGGVERAVVVNREGSYNITATIDGEEYFVKAPMTYIRGDSEKGGKNVLQILTESDVQVEIINDLINKFVIFSVVLLPIILVAIIAAWAIALISGRMNAWMEVRKWVDHSFEDVQGCEEAKRELQEVLDFFSNKEFFQKTGARAPRGILLSGPPGTGKTLLAKALAGEAKAAFIAVSGSDFRSMWYGGSARRVASMFAYARRNRPCIIFIDEFDAVASKRSSGTDIADRESNATLNQLLVEMDGFNSNDDIVVIAATNLASELDPAVMRPGRFDRRIEMTLPTADGRVEILRQHVKDKPLAADLDLERVARALPGFSGADIENLANEAAIFAARRASGELGHEDFTKARNKIVMGLERSSFILDDEEKKLVAVHEAGHALVAALSQHADPMDCATIIPHGRALGMVVRMPEKDRRMVSLAKLRDDIEILMAGRAAEEVIFGKDFITTGAESDIQAASEIARRMVSEWGFSDDFGIIRIGARDGEYSRVIDEQASAIIAAAYAKALNTLREHQSQHAQLVEALLERETLSGEEIYAIVGQENPRLSA